MAVMIGNAVCDENGKAKGGQPGNQTGRELRVQAWYKNAKGWRVFRAKSPEVAEKLAWDCRAACENMNIGYNQAKRNTLYNAAKPFGFDCAKVDAPYECDCSSLVRVCLMYAGVRVNDFNTKSEPERLLATGEFDELTDAKYTDGPSYLKRGDILVTATKGHTAIVLTDGPKAKSDPEPEPDPQPSEKHVEVLGRSVNVRDRDSVKGRIFFTAHKGDSFPFVSVAPSGWYEVLTSRGNGYITSKPKYTRLV